MTGWRDGANGVLATLGRGVDYTRGAKLIKGLFSWVLTVGRLEART